MSVMWYNLLIKVLEQITSNTIGLGIEIGFGMMFQASVLMKKILS